MAKKKLGSTKLTDELFVGSISLTADVTGVLPVTNGGTGITSFGTGVATALGVNINTAGSFVVNGGQLGTPSSGTLTNATGLPIVGGTTGTLTVARGGTGLTAGTSGGVPYYSSTTAITSSGVLSAGGVVLGGGAGTAPRSVTNPSVSGLVFRSYGVSGGNFIDPDWSLIDSTMWEAALLNQYGIVTWGTAGTETSNAIEITATVAQGPNGGGALTNTNSVVLVVVSDSATDCSPSATATITAAGTPLGTLLDGTGTATAVFRTSSAGTFRIKVTETAVGSRYLWVMQGMSSQVYLKAAATPTVLTFA